MKRRDNGLTPSPAQKLFLLHGPAGLRAATDPAMGCAGHFEVDLRAEYPLVLTPTLLEMVWLEHRPRLLAAWIGRAPGTRPFAWWRFDAPGPRQVVTPSTARDECPALWWEWRAHWGVPRGPMVWVDGGWTIAPDFMIESQAATLARLNVLIAAERRRLRPAALTPVPAAEES